MTDFAWGSLFGTGLFLMWMLGVYMGLRAERTAWTMRAMSNRPHAPNTPHHCDGEFYYIVPEKMFCEQFTRKN